MSSEDEALKTISRAVVRLEELLERLPLDLARDLRARVATLRTVVLEKRPPALALVGRRGAGKSSFVNALFGAKVAELGHVTAQTGQGRWYEVERDGGALSLLDTRGTQEGSTPAESDPAETAVDSIALELRAKPPDLVVFIAKASEVDAAVAGDLDALERVYEHIRRAHRVEPPLVAVVTHCDLLEPKSTRLHMPDSEARDDLDEKLRHVAAAEHALGDKIDQRAALRDRHVGTLGVSTYMSFRPDGTVRADERFRMSELALMLFRQMPDGARAELARVTRARVVQEELATTLTKAAAALCAGIAAAPIPIADIVPLTAVQAGLVASIAWIGGRSLDARGGAEFLAGLGANVGAAFALREVVRALLKLAAPGGGTIVSAGIAFTGTMAIGSAASAYFIAGLSLQEAKRIFRRRRALPPAESGSVSPADPQPLRAKGTSSPMPELTPSPSPEPAAAPTRERESSQIRKALPALDQPYDPAAVEPRWYAFWEAQGVFAASDSVKDERPVYVVPMPPPNVTGSLHMGHAQRVTLEDALVRWHRMRGYNALWQPGTDHAGIATQLVVERMLGRENVSRKDIGREAFVARVWQWRKETGDRILLQQRILGASADWSRSKFTMDPEMGRAVNEAFVLLYEQGLMYRATRLINWCPECMTSLSDLEVENEEGANGELVSFAYAIDGAENGEAAEIVVATTRPETMLGDAAVAVHPDDPRFAGLVGKRVAHPFLARTLPIIADAVLVDPKFGTGAVKVTPAHDFNDFATGKRHGLEEINVLNLDGTLNGNAGPFEGMERREARRAVKKALDEKGLLRNVQPHTLTLPRCQRSGGVVEPMISTQWFLKMRGMADAALEAVRSGKTEMVPAEWTKTYEHFLGHIEDWCVSRQLWWGHQIPAWHHKPTGAIRVARERPPECGPEWEHDPDVLDTWFSSALWPFSTQGWPEITPALQKFYPASDLETGYDILFFWVARMMMFGLHFMGEVPFRRVLLSGLIVDETGEKMSKVKGNVIDPLDLVFGATFADMVKKTLPGAPEAEALAKFKKAYPSAAAMGGGFPAFGADAVRFTLATYPPSNKRIALAPKRIEGNRHFLNKIWNATRLSLELLQDFQWPAEPKAPQGFCNRWIRSRFAAACELSHDGMQAFRVDEAAHAAYRFFWNELCSWYLELAKPLLREPADLAARADAAERAELIAETRETLAFVLEGSLRLLHPLMPFITEELWQRLPRPSGHRPSVAFGPYPSPDEQRSARDPDVDSWMTLLQEVVTAVRTVRSEHEIEPRAPIAVRLRSGKADVLTFLRAHDGAIKNLVRSDDLAFEATGGPREAGTTMSVVPSIHGSVEALVSLKGLVDGASEAARIERGLKRIEKDLAAVDKKLGSPGFVDRAPKEVVGEAHAQRSALLEARSRLEAARSLIEEL